MSRLHLSNRNRIVIQNALFLVLALSLSPASWSLTTIVAAFPLPQELHGVFRWARALSMALPLVWITVTVGAPVFLVLILLVPRFRSSRAYAPAIIGAWILMIATLPTMRSVDRWRAVGFAKVAHRSKPLIQAIENYKRETGDYPSQLSVLVPNHLRELPYTGAVGYPEFEYKTATQNSLFKSYQLQIFTPGGGIDFDTFNYWPERNYPTLMYGGVVERIEDWAYVHE